MFDEIYTKAHDWLHDGNRAKLYERDQYKFGSNLTQQVFDDKLPIYYIEKQPNFAGLFSYYTNKKNELCPAILITAAAKHEIVQWGILQHEACHYDQSLIDKKWIDTSLLNPYCLPQALNTVELDAHAQQASYITRLSVLYPESCAANKTFRICRDGISAYLNAAAYIWNKKAPHTAEDCYQFINKHSDRFLIEYNSPELIAQTIFELSCNTDFTNDNIEHGFKNFKSSINSYKEAKGNDIFNRSIAEHEPFELLERHQPDCLQTLTAQERQQLKLNIFKYNSEEQVDQLHEIATEAKKSTLTPHLLPY